MDCSNNTFPLPKISSGLGRHIRRPITEGINLRSCELHHPRVAELLSEAGCAAESAQFYPYLWTVLEKISEQTNLPTDQLTLAAGSDSLAGIVIDAFGVPAGKIILQTPNYFGWSYYAQLRKLHVTEAPVGVPNNTSEGFSKLLDTVKDHKNTLVVISNPNSPTGHLLTLSEVKVLADLCASYGHLLVIDECFSVYAPIDHYELLENYENVILVRSFSKSYGLAGARIAVSIASPPVTKVLTCYRAEGAVSGHSLHLLLYMLGCSAEFKTIWQDIIDSREKFQKTLKQIKPSWSVLNSYGNFVNVAVSERETTTDIVKFLEETGIYIKDTSSNIGLSGHIRFTIAHWPIMNDVLASVSKF